MQYNWRWCSKCKCLYFAGVNDRGKCKAGGSHEISGSSNYCLVLNQPEAPGQHDWRYCINCRGLFFGGGDNGICPKDGGPHEKNGSGDYCLSLNQPDASGQHDWRYCNKCKGLFFSGGDNGICPKDGGPHDENGSGDYSIEFQTPSAKWVTKRTEWEDNLGKGWSHFVPFDINGDTCFIAYNKNTGGVQFCRFKFSQKDPIPQVVGYDILNDQVKWADEWTHLVPFYKFGENRKRVNYLIAYNNKTGDVRFDHINDDFKGTVNMHEFKWPRDWSQVTTQKDISEKITHLIMYNNKKADITSQSTESGFFNGISTGRESWDQLAVLPGQLGDYILLYNIRSGCSRLCWLDINYKCPDPRSPSGFPHLVPCGSWSVKIRSTDQKLLPGFTHLVSCGEYLIAYNRCINGRVGVRKRRGRAEFYKSNRKIDTTYELVDGLDIVYSSNDWTYGWSFIMPFKVIYRGPGAVAYDYRYMIYNAENGKVQVERILD